MPKVSLIIPTRNRCALLKRALGSARLAGSDLEIIVVDDVSEDQTSEFCQGLSDIRYLRARRRLGIAGARNVGIIASSSEYIAFLDDDDLRLPGTIDLQLERLEADPDAGMIYGSILYGDQNCRPSGGSYPESFPEGDIFWAVMSWNFIPCQSVVFRRACLRRIGLMDEAASGVDDWDLWIRIAELYPVLATKQPVAVWRRSSPESGQVTSRPERLHHEARRLHQDKWLKLPRVVQATPERRREAGRAFVDRAAQQLVWEAGTALKNTQLPDFARVAFAGARMYPVSVGKRLFAPNTWRSLKRYVASSWTPQTNKRVVKQEE